jgi:hypothetical protein
MNNISLLIHGPYANNCLDKIYKNYLKVASQIAETIIVCYIQDERDYRQLLEEYPEWKINLVMIKDTINPGFFNINRQILSVQEGLKHINKNNFVIKLRNDQCVNFRKLFHILDKKQYFISNREKIVTTNCYTRRDRLYHPSDMFLCAWQSSLLKYYSAPFDEDTHLEHIMRLQMEDIQTLGKYHSLKIVPESYLFRNYLSQQGWEIKETKKDSFAALQKFTYVINSWNIDFCSAKERTPYSGRRGLILPFYLKTRPFNGVKEEKARCWNGRTINNEITTLKDVYYLLKSRIIFNLKYKHKLWFW